MFRKFEMNNEQVDEKYVVNEAHAVRVVESLFINEHFYKRMMHELGDALQYIVVPGEYINIDNVRQAILQTLAKARQDYGHHLELIDSLKRGELPDFLNDE